MIKNPAPMQETQETELTQVQSVGCGNSLEEVMGIHSSILAWKILQAEVPGGLQFIGSHRDMTEVSWPYQMVLVVRSLPANAGDVRDLDSVLGLGRSPGRGHSNPV